MDNVLEQRASEVEMMHSVASLLSAQLDRRSLAVLLQLLECGVHPEACAEGH